MAVDQQDESVAIVDQPWVVATRVTLIVVGVIFAVLVVTGVMLARWYRPDITEAYAQTQRIPRTAGWTRTIHRDAARLMLPAIGAVAIAAVGLALVRHRAARVIAPIAAGVAVLAASVTGFMLPWDQLAFKRVTVGKNISGYGDILFNHDVKYVLIGNTEIGPSTLARWFWIHTVGLPLVLLALLVVVALHTRAAKVRSVSQ